MSESASRATTEGTRHRLPIEDFDAIAAGAGDASTIRALRATEYSRRLILLYELLDRLGDEPELLGPLPEVAEAWRLLTMIEVSAANELAAVIMHPQVGIWVSHTLRRITHARGGGTPTWVATGHIYSVILAAAVRSCSDVRVQVPVQNGIVALPTLGIVRFRHVAGYRTAHAETRHHGITLSLDDQAVTVPDCRREESAHWWGLHRLRYGSGGRTLDVIIDDIDPYRDLADPVEPARLDEATVQAWRNRLRKAWLILDRGHETIADAMAVGLWSITPLPGNPEWDVRSASTGDAFGAAVMSLPPDAATMAVTMVHEFQHNKLGALLHLVDLVSPIDREPHLYAPWRPDPRPAAGLLQGVYAFVGITAFWRVQRVVGSPAERRAADFEFAFARRQAWAGLCGLRRGAHLTDWGRRFVDGMALQLRRWLREPVSAEAGRLSWAAAADHRAGWRIRNLSVDPSWLTTALTAWRQRRDPPPTTAAKVSVSPDGVMWAHHRLTAYRTRLSSGGAASSAGRSLGRRPGAGRADVLLLDGHVDRAEGEYLRGIAEAADDYDSWTGLGLAIAGQQGRTEWRALLHRPELVHALHTALNYSDHGPSPLTIARWLGP